MLWVDIDLETHAFRDLHQPSIFITDERSLQGKAPTVGLFSILDSPDVGKVARGNSADEYIE